MGKHKAYCIEILASCDLEFWSLEKLIKTLLRRMIMMYRYRNCVARYPQILGVFCSEG